MNHKVLKDESYLKAKRSLDIRIEQPLTSPQIAQIAQKIFRPGYERTSMTFYIPGDPFDKAYAVADWKNKECTVSLFGPVSNGIYAR
jgi:hypothetical protein